MGVVAMLDDVKSHFEQGKALLESHIPGLLDLAAKLESDPFVQKAITTELSPTGKAIVTDLMDRLAALEAEHAAAAPAPAEAPAEVPAESAA